MPKNPQINKKMPIIVQKQQKLGKQIADYTFQLDNTQHTEGHGDVFFSFF